MELNEEETILIPAQSDSSVSSEMTQEGGGVSAAQQSGVRH